MSSHRDVGSDGQLVIQDHSQVPSRPSRRHHRVLNIDGEFVNGSYALPPRFQTLKKTEVCVNHIAVVGIDV